ncbi:MAG: MG2 domain-containing protein, partial [Actinomycetota bacterium]|nr:MG2 domain-containing protein [Actinomycetota bacterium]
LGLVQITELGVTAVGSLPGGVVRVARLHDDSPVVGADIELIEDAGGAREVIGKTDADGLLRLPDATKLPESALLRVRAGNDRVVLDAHSLASSTTGDELLREDEEVRTTLMTERPLYRPGERVRAMGWAAIATPYELSGLRRLPPKTRVELELRDHRDELVATRTVTSKSHGKFWATLDIPETAALGHYSLSATLLSAKSSTGLRVEDYPIPEFEVSATAARTDLHGGESTTVRVDASYYFGGRVPIRRARYANECDEIEFRPPGLEPSWSVAPRREWSYGYGRGGTHSIGLLLGPGSERGHLEYEITPRGTTVSHPLRCKHSVAIGDATEREIGAEATVWVHPDFYLAARSPSSLEHGEDANIEIATLDFDGSPLKVNGIVVSLVRSWSEPEYVMEGKQRRFAGWRTRTKKLPDCKLASESAGAGVCKFSKLEHGSYEIRVRAKQGDYEPLIEDWLWVREPDNQAWAFTAPAELEIAVDRPTPAVGDKIRARVRAPWQRGRALVLLTKGGMHELHTVVLAQGSATLELEAVDAWIPWVELQVLAIEPGDANQTPRLHRASTKLTVDASSRQLAVDVEIPSEAQTGEQLPITIAVRDAAGKPVRGHVSVWAVDEAVLSLAPLELPEFIEQFSVALWTGLSVLESYSVLLLPYIARPDSYVPRDYEHDWASGGVAGGIGSGYGYGSGAGGGGGHGVGIGGAGMPSTRSNFSSAPIFIGDAELGEDGRAKLSGELPDNLTTFRLTAVASAPLASPPRSGDPVEARFGTGDARVRVTRPLVVRAALPRILRPGDQAEVGVLVDNLRGAAGTLDITVTLHDADGALELLGQSQA